MNQVLVIWSQSLQGLLFGFLNCLWQQQWAGFLGWLLQIMGWFLGQVAAGSGSEFRFYVESVHCPFVHSVSKQTV